MILTIFVTHRRDRYVTAAVAQWIRAFASQVECWVFEFHSRMFYSHGYVTITAERLHVFIYARLLYVWQFSIEGSLACHNYCDTGHPYIMVISEDLKLETFTPTAESLKGRLSLLVKTFFLFYKCS